MIYFLTVNYNSKDLVTNLIASIASGMTSPYEILIVNNSPQETDIHKLEGDRITIIESGENIGFGRACNLGIDYVWRRNRHALVWLINPDATLDVGADDYIYTSLAENPDIAILGTQIRSTHGELWFATGTFNRWTGSLKHRAKPIAESLPGEQISPAQWVTGCSFIIKLQNFNDCPAFDPHYFLYAEDADFCMRYAQQGHRIAVTNKALVSHRISSIVGRNRAFMYENYTFGRLYFLKQHATLLGLCLYLGYSLVSLSLLLPTAPQIAIGRYRGLVRFLTKSTKT